MWDISEDSGIIQLELGANVISAYSSKRKSPCDILHKQIIDLRSGLSKEHIELPTVSICHSAFLPANEFILYFGAIFFEVITKQIASFNF